ncbi:hypothetical protein BAU15_07985 [Enterococcus sp. JM4C]|uniref:hypothetical protein n=1 Tax=Candidatus Enterococcus huntleyi TaxID=1857217 RepID=UPI001379AEB8|nr:hypothetical protein [Enterococcus sp. JM4C]KAF1297834.1 hypothetical protein BAU15_07985 [Enterococcus sp. JM4C]
MMKKLASAMLVIVLCSFSTLLFTDVSYANEKDGGSVKSQGTITFVEGSKKPGVVTPGVKKPTPKTPGTGKTFPKTGELVTKSLWISGVALLFIGCYFLIFKRKSQEDQKNEEHVS